MDRLPRAAALAALLSAATIVVSAESVGLHPWQATVQVAPPPDTAEPARLLLAMMRRDGIMIPFAEYERGKWTMPWPAVLRNVEIPAHLDAVPEDWWGGPRPTEWRLWPTGAGEPASLTLQAPIVLTIGWERRLGIRTGHVSSEPATLFSELPYPKDGLAIAGGGTLQPIPFVSRHAPQWREMTGTLKADIDAAEEKTVAQLRNRTGWAHAFSAEQRKALPAELEAWYTSQLGQPGWAVSYIEAIKKYPLLPEDEGCGLETFVSGWVHHNTRSPRPKTELTARVTYCDRAGVSYMLPFGMLRLRNRTHWVVQISSRHEEWYEVLEATPDRVRFVAEYFAGGRPEPR